MVICPSARCISGWPLVQGTRFVRCSGVSEGERGVGTVERYLLREAILGHSFYGHGQVFTVV